MLKLEQLIYITLTILIPLRSTFSSLRYNSLEDQKLWSIYWLFYFAFKSLQWNFSVFQYRPLDFLFVLACIWFYGISYRGALFLEEFWEQRVSKIKVVEYGVNFVSEKVQILGLFEGNPVSDEKNKKQ